jgi:hypothetical protein
MELFIKGLKKKTRGKKHQAEEIPLITTQGNLTDPGGPPSTSKKPWQRKRR